MDQKTSSNENIWNFKLQDEKNEKKTSKKMTRNKSINDTKFFFFHFRPSNQIAA